MQHLQMKTLTCALLAVRLAHGFLNLPLPTRSAPLKLLPTGGPIITAPWQIEPKVSIQEHLIAGTTARKRARPLFASPPFSSIPPTIVVLCSALLHVLGGLLGIPTVFSATKPGGWYQRIDLPPWTPPNRLFGPVWTALYACMGIAAGRMYHLLGGTMSNVAMRCWSAHYALNLMWVLAFFGQKRFRLGLWMNVALTTSVVAIGGWLYYPIDRLSAYLLVPYLLWLSFATALNWSICKRNPTVHGYNEAKFQSDLVRLQAQAAKSVGLEPKGM